LFTSFFVKKLPGAISISYGRQEDRKKYSFFTKGVDFLYKGVVKRYFRERPAMVKMREIEEKLKPILGLKTDASLKKIKNVEVKPTSKYKKIKLNIIGVFILILVIMFLVSIPIGIITTWKWIINAIF
jgi:hypothetical protein